MFSALPLAGIGKLVQIYLPGMESCFGDQWLNLEAKTKIAITAVTLGAKYEVPLHPVPARMSLCLDKHL